MLVGLATPVDAQPADNQARSADLTLSLADVGSGQTLMFFGDTSSTSLSFPVPAGLRPATLNATLDLPFPVRSGTLSVLQGERLITRIALPTTDLAPVALPLNAVEVTDDTVTVTLRLSALAEDGYCLDPETALVLFNGSVTYTGTETVPATVADFLPPILRTVTLGIPGSPSQAESNAAVQLAASLQARYRSQSSRWSALRGSAVVAIEGSEPQMVPDRTPVSVYGPAPSDSQTGDQDQSRAGVSATWIAVAVFAAIGIGAGAYWMGRRRRQAPPEPPTTPGSPD